MGLGGILGGRGSFDEEEAEEYPKCTLPMLMSLVTQGVISQ